MLAVAAVGMALTQKGGGSDIMPVPSPPGLGNTEPEAVTPERQPGRENIVSFAPVVDRVMDSVVGVHTSRLVKVPEPLRNLFGTPNGGIRQGLGSGVLVSRDGYILTNNHVTAGAQEVTVTVGKDRKEYKARKVGADPGTDLSVLKIEGHDLPAIPFADSQRARVGDVVLAVGNPFGLTQTVTMGIISGLRRGGMGIIDYENFIQTDASVNPGNSGGALVDMNGRLVGINTAIFSRSGGNQGIGFAIPADLAAHVLARIRENGRVERGYLGTLIQPVTKELAAVLRLPSTDGALVADVTDHSPAQENGLQPGDVITEIAGKHIQAPRDLRLAIGDLQPGSPVSLSYIREGKTHSIALRLGTTPPKEEESKGDEPPPVAERRSEPFLEGVRLSDVDDDFREILDLPSKIDGAVIIDIDPLSRAYRSGLRRGHVIVEVNRTPVHGAKELLKAGREGKSETPVLLRVWSGGQSQYLAIAPKDIE